MRIGIVGTGQLARMLALAGMPMGLSFAFLATADEDDSPVHGLGNVVRNPPGTTPESLYRALGEPAVITVEKEEVETDLLASLKRFCPVYPDPDIIRICQHRGRQKGYLGSRAVPVAPFLHAGSRIELERAVKALGFPVVVKSCRQGYDGLNQWRLDNSLELDRLLLRPDPMADYIVEKRVEFSREISLIAVRSRSGMLERYPVAENSHRGGILLTSLAPAADISAAVEEQLDRILHAVMSGWNYVGVLAIECFQLPDGKVLVNELAPRVHNSGHWTQQGAHTSQFENHLRAITGLGLGSVSSFGSSAMLNVLGRQVPDSLRGDPLAHVHLYGKSMRPGRKLGHINFQHTNRSLLEDRLASSLALLYPEFNKRVDKVA